MACSKLADVRSLLEKREEGVTGPYVCVVTNFDSDYPWPRRFTYRGCVFLKGPNWMCGTSIEGSKLCSHKAALPGNHKDLFRFDLYLSDLNFGGIPLRVTIFDQARKLLHMAPEDFQLLKEDKQVSLLHSATKQNLVVNVFLRTDTERRCSIQRLDQVISLDSPPASPPDRNFTPMGDFNFATPSSSKPSGSGLSSSSSRAPRTVADLKAKLGLDDGDTKDLKRSLVRAMEVLNVLDSTDE